jgi:6-phosphogluconolactonase
MKPNLNIFPSPEELAENLALDFFEMTQNYRDDRKINVAISGGNTPKSLFKVLANRFSTKICWEKINFFWVDERCVPPDDQESNYGMTRSYLLDHIQIPVENVFRIKGEDEPSEEAERYSDIVSGNVGLIDGFPSFDLIILGIGEDGHTASIFPDQFDLLNSDKIYTTAIHPITKQKRITATGLVINNSKWTVFQVTGKSKSKVISKILLQDSDAKLYPAFYIKPKNGNLNWYLDEEAISDYENV